jgi:hypothetical protein
MVKVMLIAVTAATAIQATPLSGQERAGRRWSLTLAFGQRVGGPSGVLEGAMRDGGFAASTECWLFCTGEIEHPWTSGPGFTGLLAVRYALNPRLSLEALYSPGGDQVTFGAADELLNLMVSHAVTTIGAVASTTLRLVEREGRSGALRVGIGPAVYSIKSGQGPPDRTGNDRNSTRVGFLIDGGLELPDRSRVFLDVRAQWRLAGSAVFGPYEAGLSNVERKTLPETDATCNHLFFSVGLGVRL